MKIFFAVVMLIITGMQANSQCDKKIKWYAAKGEMYHTNGNLLYNKQDSVFLETGPQKISLKFQSDDQALEGVIKEKICDWKDPFKNGKTVYHTDVSIDGMNSNATFTVEAKDKKITLTVEIEARKERKFLIYLDKYEEIE